MKFFLFWFHLSFWKTLSYETNKQHNRFPLTLCSFNKLQSTSSFRVASCTSKCMYIKEKGCCGFDDTNNGTSDVCCCGRDREAQWRGTDVTQTEVHEVMFVTTYKIQITRNNYKSGVGGCNLALGQIGRRRCVKFPFHI